MPITLGNTSITGITGNQGIGALFDDLAPAAQLDVRGTLNGVSLSNDTGKSFSSFNATNNSADRWNSVQNAQLLLTLSNNSMSFLLGGTVNNRVGGIQVGHASTTFASALGTLALNPFGGDVLLNNGFGSARVFYGCRAWVNFNGTGTVAIRASGNVSSITDVGAGSYRVNFATAMPDANYAPSMTGSNGTASGLTFATEAAGGGHVKTATTYGLVCFNYNTGSTADRVQVSAAFFR